MSEREPLVRANNAMLPAARVASPARARCGSFVHVHSYANGCVHAHDERRELHLCQIAGVPDSERSSEREFVGGPGSERVGDGDCDGSRERESRGSGGGGLLVQLVGATAALLGFGYAAICIAGRLSSPWPLEWMEGASVLHAQRLLRGLPLYAAPRADFIPFVYPPFSYVPMGLGLVLSGGALWGARLASVLALILCCVALWRAARHLSGAHGAGLLAAGLFAMGYGYSGGFSDLARVDAWFCALSLCGVERLCARRYTQGLVLLALACLAKQHAVLLLAAAIGGVWLRLGRRSLAAIVTSALGLTGCVAALWGMSDGWIWTYCVTVPARHGLDPSLLVSFVLVDLCVYLPLLVGLCVYSIVTRRDESTRLLHGLLLAAVVASALGRAHPGGDDNVRLPAYAFAALVAAVSCCELLASKPRLRWLLLIGLAAQFVMLFQSPALYWPTQQSSARFLQLQAALVQCAGSNDFAAMDHVGLGEHPFVHTLALSDLRMNQDDLAERATDAVLAALRGPPSPRALALSSSFPALMQTLAEHYELCARAPAPALPTGYQLQETFIYRRRAD